jgi:hypothetical protein
MKKFSLSSFAAGMVCTVAIFGLGTTAYAAYVNLNPSTTKLVVDGAAVDVIGYNVESRNYFQLRELAKIFDVSLEWEAATDTAYMDSTKPYVEETPVPVTTPPVSAAATLANGKAITDANILEILAEIEKEYPDGTAWDENKYYYSPTFGAHGGCNAWAFMVSDRIFGDYATYRTHSNIYDIKVGDVVLLLDKNTGSKIHYFVVTRSIEVNALGREIFRHCDGNVNGKISWSGTAYVATYESKYTFTIYTRYPA